MKHLLKSTILLAALVSMASCKKDEDTPGEDGAKRISAQEVTSILGTIDGAYYLAQAKDISEGSLTFLNNGTQLDADQAAKVIIAGDYLYSLNYGTGVLSQLQPTDKNTYVTIKEVNVGLAVGTNRPRYALADDNTLMVYNVEIQQEKNSSGEVTDNNCIMRLVTVSIPEMTVGSVPTFVIPQTENAAEGATIGYDPTRIDSPVISGDKIYWGLMHTDVYDLSVAPPFRSPKQTGLETLVFDYPSFTNGTIIESDEASGHTGGYRTHSMHKDENGDVYQSNWFMDANGFDLSSGDKTVIMKITDGDYDETYSFNISDKLGLTSNVGTVGWYYVGNGIGFMPIHLEDEGNYYSEDSWSVARIDLYNQTAVKLDVPLSQLFTYESGIVKDGKFYMAISPSDSDAYIYEFDPASTATTEEGGAFTKGLKLDGANLHVEGIY